MLWRIGSLASCRLSAPMRQRITQFRQTIQLNYAGSPYVHSAPPVPDAGAIETKFLAPFDEVSQIWGQINVNIVPPNPQVLLPGDYTLQQFNAGVASLKVSFQIRDTADMQAKMRRDERDALLKPIYERMLQYRTAVVLHLPAGNPLLSSVPRLSPIPGTTPPGLVVAGVWNGGDNKAHLSWTASTFHDILKLQVRGCTGTTFKADDEEIIADLAADAIEYSTDWGLTVPGALATFKVYVMTNTGNENGGKAVKIVRPET